MSGNIEYDSLCRLTESPETHWSRYPSLICDRGGHYCISWYRYPPPATGIPCQIFFCKGSDRLDSIAALEPAQVTDDGRNHTGGVLCQDGPGSYWLAWHCWTREKGPRSILFSRSADGRIWSPAIQPLPQIDEYMIHPTLVCHSAGTFWLAFTSGLGPHSRIHLSSSQDGQTWSEPTALPVGSQGEDKATLAVGAGGELLIVWRFAREARHGLRWSASKDGLHWQTAREITMDLADPQRPKLSLDHDGVIWLVYEGDGAIWLRHLTPAGSWSEASTVNSGPYLESRPSALVQNKQGAYWLAWTSTRSGTELWGCRISVPRLAP